MNDLNNIAVVGPKEVTQIFEVCGFDVRPELTQDVMDKYALVINTGEPQPNKQVETPYPILLEVKWKK